MKPTDKTILQYLDDIEDIVRHSFGGDPFTEEEHDTLNALYDIRVAVEKQIPTKAENPTGRYTDNLCPLCRKRIKSGKGSSARERTNWCNHCGQKINWSEE